MYAADTPTFRSVAVMPAMGVPKFGKAPAIGLPRPKGGLSGGLSTAPRKTSFTVAQEWTGTAPATWNVTEEDLEMVPVDFPLERTHREISCDVTEVAKRISDSLQRLSIDAKYDNGSAKAKCKTMECVKFRIRLYAGGDSGQPVVVECQRREGSTNCFMRSCRAVLDAAEGVEASKSAAPKKFAVPPMNVGAMKCLQSATVKGPSPEEEAAAAFDAAASLCKSDKRDSVVLGLQSLCSLTDPLKSSPATAIKVSKWVLVGHETQSTREDVSSILQLVAEDEEEELAGLFETQKHYALIALANALDMCAKDGSLATAVTEDSWFEETLIPALLTAIKGAKDAASNAYAAARGINSLLSSADAARSMVEALNGMATLKDAHAYGLENHDLLASETKCCLK